MLQRSRDSLIPLKFVIVRRMYLDSMRYIYVTMYMIYVYVTQVPRLAYPKPRHPLGESQMLHFRRAPSRGCLCVVCLCVLHFRWAPLRACVCVSLCVVCLCELMLMCVCVPGTVATFNTLIFLFVWSPQSQRSSFFISLFFFSHSVWSGVVASVNTASVRGQ
jgi:hypothetical protein